MNSLILWRLKRFCDEHELDYQEIDNTLTYWENKEHLKSLTPEVLDASNYTKEHRDRWRAEEIRYRAEHFLHYYIMAARMGETKSKDVGPPIKPGFSLKAYINSLLFWGGSYVTLKYSLLRNTTTLRKREIKRTIKTIRIE